MLKLLGIQILIGQSGLGFVKSVQDDTAIMWRRLLLKSGLDLQQGGQPATGIDRQAPLSRRAMS
jgi:hypothetical protein